MNEKLRCVDPECKGEIRTGFDGTFIFYTCRACDWKGPPGRKRTAALAAWKRVQKRSNPEPICVWIQNNTSATWSTGCGRTIRLDVVIGPCPYCKRRIRVADPGSGEGE